MPLTMIPLWHCNVESMADLRGFSLGLKPLASNVRVDRRASYGIPSGYVKIAIENGHRNTGFSHEKWVDFP